MRAIRKPKYPGVLGRVLEQSKIPEEYFVGSSSNIFDAVHEGLSFLILVTEHEDVVVGAVKEDAGIGTGVTDGLRELREYTERVANEFTRLGGCIDRVTREVEVARNEHC